MILNYQSTMSIPRVARGHGETLFPLRKKTQFQKAIRRFDAINSRQSQFFHRAVLKRPEYMLDATVGLGTLHRDPFDPQFP
jgi:hypothetical protein